MIDIDTPNPSNPSYRSTGVVSRQRRGVAARRRREVVSTAGGILVVALDNVEAIRSTHGEPTLDLVRDHMARVLRLCLHADDGLVRWGDEEFMILLPRSEAQRVADLAELLVVAVRVQPVDLGNDELLRLTCSVGWSSFDWDRRPSQQPWREPIIVADVALALAKGMGGDCSVSPSAELGSFEAPQTLEAPQELEAPQALYA